MKTVGVLFFAVVICSFLFALPTQASPDLDLCPLCVKFSEEAIEKLVQIIVSGGITGGCAEVCSYLPAKAEQEACNLICDVVGIEEFSHLLQKADLDPIYYCQLLKLCPVHDCQGKCAEFVSTNVDPHSGPEGTTFKLSSVFQILNETGTGEIAIDVKPPEGPSFGTGSMVPKGYKPGAYKINFDIPTKPSGNRQFPSGRYNGQIAVCEGECGSDHPHSRILAEDEFAFEIK